MAERPNEPALTTTEELVLRDGTLVGVRAIEPTDTNRLLRFHHDLSPESRRMRFFTPHPHLTGDELLRFTVVDHHDREALVVLHDDVIIAVGRYDRVGDSDEAEVAFAVADDWQGKGIGTELFRRLRAHAVAHDIVQVVADTMGENQGMLRVFAHAEPKPVKQWDHGVVHLEMRLDESES